MGDFNQDPSAGDNIFGDVDTSRGFDNRSSSSSRSDRDPLLSAIDQASRRNPKLSQRDILEVAMLWKHVFNGLLLKFDSQSQFVVTRAIYTKLNQLCKSLLTFLFS